MDRFIIRNPQPSSSNGTSSSGRRLKQTTIESLKGVVVIDDILHHKSRLQLATTTKEEMIHSLHELGKKIPPRNVMMSTKIGRVINKLRNHEDEEVRKCAKQVYVKWRSHFVEHKERPMMEVRCDRKTEKLRASGRTMLTESLAVETSHKLPETIERETFQIHKRMANNSYRRTMRALIFMLKNKDDVRARVLSGETTVTNFVKENKKL